MDAKQKGHQPPTGGKCVLAGAGPGDPGLLTLRAKEYLERADVIVYDALCPPTFLRWARREATVVFAGKRASKHALSQDEINALLVKETAAGKLVVRLKGGDPFVFGRGGEEAEALAAAGLEFEVVPGVTAAFAAPAYAGIPVTHRRFASEVTVFTGHEDPDKDRVAVDYDALARGQGTRVMLMGVERLGAITRELLARGASSELPVAVIRQGTTGEQRTVVGPLATIAEQVAQAGLTAPAVAVFGDVVRLRDRLQWFEKRPLCGRRIVVTRTREQAGGLAESLRALGAEVIDLPTIRIEPPKDEKGFRTLVADAHTYDWLVFSSPNGVEAFFERFFKIYADARDLGNTKIATIGPATAARVAAYRFQVDLQPEEHVAEALVSGFDEFGSLENLRLLVVRAEVTRDVIAAALTAQGAIVDEAVAYRTMPDQQGALVGLGRMREIGADLVTFTSSSTVDNFLALDPPLPPAYQTASIGPITSATLRSHGLPVDIEAEQYDIPGLVAAIRAAAAGRRPPP